MIWLFGDTHREIDFSVLEYYMDGVDREMGLTRKDYAIVCGDFGGVWDDSEFEHRFLDEIAAAPYTLLFVDGNHENHPLLNAFPVTECCGGKVHRVRDNIIHLMRGQVFIIDGYKFFTMGGAVSHDKAFRVEGVGWWPEELPSCAEYEEAQRNLSAHSNKVDFIVTHCAPNSIHLSMNRQHAKNSLTSFLEVAVKQAVRYRHWFFGHYHDDWVWEMDKRHTCLYRKPYYITKDGDVKLWK